MKKKQKKSLIKNVIQFIKLQLAGNILFWGTLGGTFVFYNLLGWSELPALVVSSLIAHVAFFIVDREWVFEDSGNRRKSSREISRFIIFMGFNFFLNIGIIQGLVSFTPLNIYVSQFVAAAFFTIWSYVGLKFWVFQMPEHHAITIKTKKAMKRRHARRAA